MYLQVYQQQLYLDLRQHHLRLYFTHVIQIIRIVGIWKALLYLQVIPEYHVAKAIVLIIYILEFKLVPGIFL